MSSKLVEAAARALNDTVQESGRTDWGGPIPVPNYRGAAQAAILAFLEAALEDEGVIEAGAEAIADAMNMNRPGRLENDAARAALRALIQQVKS
jgi:hypothetical protein